LASALALLIARLMIGPALAAHGAQKLLGWFGGHGLKATAGIFGSIGFPAPLLMAALASLGEIGGGLLLALGWLNPVGPAIIVSVMLVAAVSVHARNGFFAMKNGYELPWMYAASAIALAFAGPGAISLDALAPIPALSDPATAWLLIAIGALGGLLVLALRRAPRTGGQSA